MDRDIFFSIVESANLDKIKIEAARFYCLPQNSQVTSDGRTPLHFMGSYESNGTSHAHIYRFLCDVGRHHLNAKDKKGNAPIHIAAQSTNPEAVAVLVESGANLDAVNNEKLTALHYAALVASFEIAECLVNASANLNLQDHIGQTPLHYSVIQKQERITRLLMRRNADPNILTFDGLSAMQVALKNNDFDTITLLINHGADVSSLYSEKENSNLAKHFSEDNPTGVDDVFGFFATQDQPKYTENIGVKSVERFDNRLQKYSSSKKGSKKNSIHASFREKKLLKELVAGTLPNSRRGRWWKLCIGDVGYFQAEYEAMGREPFDNKEASQIDKDINRCLRFHKMFAKRYGEGQCKLYRVLKAYATQNRGTKYTQGMSTIAAILLIYFPTEAEAYGAMRLMFENYSLHHFYANNLTGLTQTFPIFEKLCQTKCPQIHNHMIKYISKTMNIESYSSLFLTNWLLECFFSSLPHSLSLKCWDIFLYVGPAFLFAMGLSMLAEIQVELLATTDMGKLITLIKNTETRNWDEPRVLKRALKFNIKNAEIAPSLASSGKK